jgi:tetratricopeptide (TPR) repeat protein
MGAWLLDRAAALAPSVLALETYVVLRVRALHAFPGVQHVHPTDNPLLLLSEPQRTASALALLARYVRLFLWPAGLAIDVSGPVFPTEPSLLAPRAVVGLLVLLLAAAALMLPMLLGERRSPPLCLLAVSAAVFLLPYLVVSNLLVPIGALFADRLFYLPSAGLCLGAGALAAWSTGTLGLPDLGRHRRGLLAVLAGTAVLLGSASWTRTRVWRSDATIFADALRVHPDSPRAHFILGKLSGDAGRDQEALASFDRAIAVWPSYIPAYQEKGVVLGRMGRLAEAEEAFRETLRRSPAYDAAHYNLGLVLRRQGRAAEAERELRKALLLDPSYARAWAELGHLLADQGRRREAADAYRHAVVLGRDDLRPRLQAMGGLARHVAPHRGGHSPHHLHHPGEPWEVEALPAVGQGLVRPGMDLHQQAVRARGHGRGGQGGHELAEPGGVARVHEDGQMRARAQDGHRREVEGGAGGALEGADPPLAEQHLRVSRGHHVLRRQQQLVERGGQPRFRSTGVRCRPRPPADGSSACCAHHLEQVHVPRHQRRSSSQRTSLTTGSPVSSRAAAAAGAAPPSPSPWNP